MPDTRRLFFALWPSAALRAQLAAQTAPMVAQYRCRPVPGHNLHVTLAFLGAVPEIRIPELIELGRSMKVVGCELAFDSLAVWRPARVLVLSASHTPEALLHWVQHLQSQLASAGFQIDERPYSPHVTLARAVHAPVGEPSGKPLAEQVAPMLVWPVATFVLAQSVSSPGGVQYQVLATFPG